jgi:hypothetical protein
LHKKIGTGQKDRDKIGTKTCLCTVSVHFHHQNQKETHTMNAYNLALTFAITLALSIFLLILDDVLNLPVVVYSNYAQDCVYVIDGGVPSNKFDCDALPEKYSTYWSE